jgi:hypothetical protein
MMASPDELAALRRAADIAADDATYTDGLISPLIDSLGVNGAAAVIWRELAAKYASMVSMTEAGSSRSMSDLYTHAKEMADMYARLADEEETPVVPPGAGYTYTIGIERV